MASTNNNQVSPFLCLPPEIRAQIYEQCFRSNAGRWSFRTRLNEPRLASVCRSIRTECLPVFYDNTRLGLSLTVLEVDHRHDLCVPKIASSLDRLSPTAVRLVTKFDIDMLFRRTNGRILLEARFRLDIHPQANTYTLCCESHLRDDTIGSDEELKGKLQTYIQTLELEARRSLDSLIDSPGAGKFGRSHLEKLSCIANVTFWPSEEAASFGEHSVTLRSGMAEHQSTAVEQSPLLKLPRELRDLIYTFAFATEFAQSRCDAMLSPPPLRTVHFREPPLLSTTRKIRRETLPLYYSGLTLALTTAIAINSRGDIWMTPPQRWTRLVPPHKLAMVRRLHVLFKFGQRYFKNMAADFRFVIELREATQSYGIEGWIKKHWRSNVGIRPWEGEEERTILEAHLRHELDRMIDGHGIGSLTADDFDALMDIDLTSFPRS